MDERNLSFSYDVTFSRTVLIPTCQFVESEYTCLGTYVVIYLLGRQYKEASCSSLNFLVSDVIIHIF